MLSAYHQKYASQSDIEIQKRLDEKEHELKSIKSAVKPSFSSERLRVAVLGCGDKRFIPGHRKIFASVFDLPVTITTFDITNEHLAGEENVIEHDITQPLPSAPYDITYGHVVLKFIKGEEHWKALKNSFDALVPGGLAIHIMDSEDYSDSKKVLADGFFPVSLQDIRNRLDDAKIKYYEVAITYGLALVLVKGA